jgi:hypothetical protein
MKFQVEFFLYSCWRKERRIWTAAVDTEFIVKQPECLLTACDQIAKNGGNIRPVEELKTQLAVIPGGLTSQLQLPYVAVNKTF